MPYGTVLAYGALGLPLAFAALPLYVHVPRYYAEVTGMELARLGAILLGEPPAVLCGDGALVHLVGDASALASAAAMVLKPHPVAFADV